MNTPAASELIIVFITILILFAFARYFWNLMSEAKKNKSLFRGTNKITGRDCC